MVIHMEEMVAVLNARWRKAGVAPRPRLSTNLTAIPVEMAK